MSRGYRHVLTALAGLAALLTAAGWGLMVGASNYPQEQRHQAYRYASDKPEESDRAAPDADAQRLEYREPCREPKGSTESDLCAQWRAAKAAENSAFWAEWSVWVSVVGMIGLLWTLYYTRKAVLAAEEATKDADAALDIARQNASAASAGADHAARASEAANRANLIAQESMQRQLRPHLYVIDIHAASKPHDYGDEYLFIEARPIIRNFGQAAGKNVTFRARLILGGYWSVDFQADIADQPEVPLGSVPPELHLDTAPYTIKLTHTEFFMVKGSTSSLFVEGEITYRDDFGMDYVTQFRRACTGLEDVSSWTFRPTPNMNHAT